MKNKIEHQNSHFLSQDSQWYPVKSSKNNKEDIFVLSEQKAEVVLH